MQLKRGFTLVELMVTIVVVAIITTIAIPSFQNMILRQNLRTTAYNIRDMLKETRSRAVLNQNEIVLCTSINKSASTVTESKCGAFLTNYSSRTNSLKKSSVFIVNIEKKITLKNTSDDNFVFSPRGNLNSTKIITLCSAVESYILKVDMSGTVDISQGAAC